MGKMIEREEALFYLTEKLKNALGVTAPLPRKVLEVISDAYQQGWADREITEGKAVVERDEKIRELEKALADVHPSNPFPHNE